jgi:hypothetical protein
MIGKKFSGDPAGRSNLQASIVKNEPSAIGHCEADGPGATPDP